MPTPVTLLHASDVHLGSGPSAREEAFFAGLVQLARQLSVDALLVAGDLFDHARVPDATLAYAAEQFALAGCPVVVLPGNHDLYHDASVYRRFDFAAACPDLQVLTDHDGELVEVPGTDLVVWGRAMLDHSPDFRPLGGVPAAPPAHDRWCVIAGHGLVMDDDTDTTRGSPIYPRDLDAVGDGWHYVALGHLGRHHVVREGPVPVCYAGPAAPQRGGAPGATLVTFDADTGVVPQFVAVPMAEG